MPKALVNTRLLALDKAVDAAATAISLVARAPAPLKPIANQVIRSASSVPANLAEGHGRVVRNGDGHGIEADGNFLVLSGISKEWKRRTNNEST